jgi:hypothetical protein
VTLWRQIRAFLGCAHRHTVRERRVLKGTTTAVLHFVCEACGHAAPAVDRSLADHRRVVKLGAVQVSRATAKASEPATVTSIEAKRKGRR